MNQTSVAIHQPNFLPWIGYFNKIKAVDVFVLFDDVQFERGKTYTSRTKILIQGSETWLTVPVANKSSLVPIKNVEVIPDFTWKTKHLKTLYVNYKKAPCFDTVFPIIEKVYKNESLFLVDYNISLIRDICDFLEITTKFVKSSELRVDSYNANDRIIGILKSVNATEYLSGAGAGSKRYINPEEFELNNIVLKWQNFEITPYSQIASKEFVRNLSVIDLLFNKGKDSIHWL